MTFTQSHPHTHTREHNHLLTHVEIGKRKSNVDQLEMQMKKLSGAGFISSRNQPQTEPTEPTERKRERQAEAQETLPKCSVHEKCKIQIKIRKGDKVKKQKVWRAFHMRIYVEFQNLMRWAVGQIMLCK